MQPPQHSSTARDRSVGVRTIAIIGTINNISASVDRGALLAINGAAVSRLIPSEINRLNVTPAAEAARMANVAVALQRNAVAPQNANSAVGLRLQSECILTHWRLENSRGYAVESDRQRCRHKSIVAVT